MFEVEDIAIAMATEQAPENVATTKPAKRKEKTITERQGEILAYIEQVFWTEGKLPSDDLIVSATGIPADYVRKCWKSAPFRDQLFYRGIQLTPESEIAVKLTPEQLKVANALLNIVDRRSLREKLKALEVSPQQYSAWRRQPAFAEYLRVRAEELFRGADADAYKGLVDLVQDGDLGAIKLFMEMRKIYNPKVEVNININHFMLKIVEVITKHVTDEATLNAIAIDIEAISELGSCG